MKDLSAGTWCLVQAAFLKGDDRLDGAVASTGKHVEGREQRVGSNQG
jgi:hypothetical protein